MKCQNCGKKEATVRYYENINGNQKEIFLCADCAKKLGFNSFSDIFSPIYTTITGFMDDEDEDAQICPNCGYSFDEYTKTGLFGCPECYNTFKDKLDSMFLKLNGKNRHVPILKNTKVSNNIDNNDKKLNKIDELKAELKKLVNNEEYEKAAKIRDEIKKIQKEK